jgi:hypothetical protein
VTVVLEEITRIGSTTPRLFTPPIGDHLGPDGWVARDWSWGYDCIEFLERCVGWTLLPWQRWLYVHALEKDSDRTGFRFSTVLVLISRQNGKSRWLTGLGLWRLFADEYGRSSADCPGARTALLACQNLKYAETMLKDVAEDVRAAPLLSREFKTHRLDNGSNRIELTHGRQWRVVAANRRGGRGLAVDLVMLDELREHQTWDAWNAIVPTTTARPYPQVVCCSNAGDVKSEVLRTLRDGAKRCIQTGETRGTNVGMFEWSAPPDADPRDESYWYMPNPAMGHKGMFTLADLRGYLETQQYRNMPGWQTEHLCQFVDALEPGIVPAEHWAATLDLGSRRDPGAPVYAAVDVNYARAHSYVAIAAARADGHTHVEVIAAAHGTDWLIDWLLERKTMFAGIAVQKTSAPVSGLIPEMAAAGLNNITLLPVGVELQTACGLLYDGICEHTIFHRPAPMLDRAAASGVARTAGDAWVFDRRNSPVDVAPLIAVAAAVWLKNYIPDVKHPVCHVWPDEQVIAQWEQQATRRDDELERAWMMTPT